MTLVPPSPSSTSALSLAEEETMEGAAPRDDTTPRGTVRRQTQARDTSSRGAQAKGTRQTQAAPRAGSSGDTYDISTITSGDMSFVGLAVSDAMM